MNKDAIIRLVNEQMWPKTDADIPSFKAGDTITVTYKIVEGNKERLQSFRGVVIQIKGTGKTKMFTIRKISNGVGVERIFPLYSPHIDKIEVNKVGVVRRARIYYLRNLTGKKARIKGKPCAFYADFACGTFPRHLSAAFFCVCFSVRRFPRRFSCGRCMLVRAVVFVRRRALFADGAFPVRSRRPAEEDGSAAGIPDRAPRRSAFRRETGCDPCKSFTHSVLAGDSPPAVSARNPDAPSVSFLTLRSAEKRTFCRPKRFFY